MRAPLRSGGRPGGVRGRLEATWAMASTSTSSSESSTATSSQSTATRESSSTTNSDKVSSFLDRLKVPQPSQLQCSRAREHKIQFFSLKILESTKFVVKPPDFLHTYLDMFSMTCASLN